MLLERAGTAWVATSSEKLLERMGNVACAIRDAGLSAGDRVALVAHNCVDWIVTDFATLSAGCVVVPIYPTQALDHTKYILEHSEAKLVFVDNAQTLAHLRESGAALPRCVSSNRREATASLRSKRRARKSVPRIRNCPPPTRRRCIPTISPS